MMTKQHVKWLSTHIEWAGVGNLCLKNRSNVAVRKDLQFTGIEVINDGSNLRDLISIQSQVGDWRTEFTWNSSVNSWIEKLTIRMDESSGTKVVRVSNKYVRCCCISPDSKLVEDRSTSKTDIFHSKKCRGQLPATFPELGRTPCSAHSEMVNDDC